MMYSRDVDNLCYWLAKNELHPDDCMGDLTQQQMAEIIQLATKLKDLLREH